MRTVLLLAALVVAIGGAAWLVSYFGEKGKFDAAGAKGGIVVERMLVGRLKGNSRLDITVRNSQASDAVIRRVWLEARYDGGVDCCCPPTDTITLSDRIQMSRSTGAGTIAGAFRTTSTEEYDYAVEGTLHDSNCDSLDLVLEMDTAIGLTRDALTTLRIVIPATMQVTSVERTGGRFAGDEEPPPSPSSYPLDLSRFQSFAVRLDMNTGQSVTSAYPENPVAMPSIPPPPRIIVAPVAPPANSSAN